MICGQLLTVTCGASFAVVGQSSVCYNGDISTGMASSVISSRKATQTRTVRETQSCVCD